MQFRHLAQESFFNLHVLRLCHQRPSKKLGNLTAQYLISRAILYQQGRLEILFLFSFLFLFLFFFFSFTNIKIVKVFGPIGKSIFLPNYFQAKEISQVFLQKVVEFNNAEYYARKTSIHLTVDLNGPNDTVAVTNSLGNSM